MSWGGRSMSVDEVIGTQLMLSCRPETLRSIPLVGALDVLARWEARGDRSEGGYWTAMDRCAHVLICAIEELRVIERSRWTPVSTNASSCLNRGESCMIR